MHFFAQLQEEFPVNDMGDLSWYLGCAFERDKSKGVVKMTQTAFVDSLVERFDIKYESQIPASIELILGRRGVMRKTAIDPISRRSVVYCGSQG